MDEEGNVTFATNDAFDEWFQTANDFVDDLVRRKTMTSLLIARCVFLPLGRLVGWSVVD
jgi:hypothetical protein